MSCCTCRRRSIASRVYSPCLSAFLFRRGAPDPAAPPCMRQRFLPLTAGDMHGFPDRVLAPQRGLASIGPVLRGCLPLMDRIPAAAAQWNASLLMVILAPLQIDASPPRAPPQE